MWEDALHYSRPVAILAATCCLSGAPQVMCGLGHEHY